MTNSGQIKAPAAIAFETGLIVLAAVLGWLLDRWPLPGVSLTADSWREQGSALAWGTLAAVPLILALLLFDRFPCGLWGDLQQTVERRLLPWIRHWSVLDMALISLAAGFGEEMLFRGLLQVSLAEMLPGIGGVALALVVASVVFGICHWITTSYALLASVMGLYLGVVLLFTENLLAPIATHAVYDFAALIYLTRFRPQPEHSREYQDP
jgi:membrane protease YdiL (CAAX protease family)